MAEKLGAVRQDPDQHGLLFTLINRATGGRQERAARACRHLTTGEGRGLRFNNAMRMPMRCSDRPVVRYDPLSLDSHVSQREA